jgi:WXG100 family type VII secretion target
VARDIDVDITELERFITVLRKFQDTTTDRLRALESDWAKCDETWQGDAKEQFTKGFEQTKDAVDRSLEVGEEAVDWLERFHEIVKDFERQLPA